MERSAAMHRGVLYLKANGALRYLMAHTASRILPLYIVNEYPKSGGSWVGEMLSDALGVPFPRNRFPVFGRSILHGHMMHSWNMHNVVVVWRDGRDVLVSQYFHYLFENERGNRRLVELSRGDLQFDDYSDVTRNLVPFMKYVYERKRHPRMSWMDFVTKWSERRGCVHVRYEDLRESPVRELRRVVGELSGTDPGEQRAQEIVDGHSFERVSGRKAGVVNANSFMRKGVVGDWRNYFSKEAREQFHTYAGEGLIKLGYEKDNSWVSAADVCALQI